MDSARVDEGDVLEIFSDANLDVWASLNIIKDADACRGASRARCPLFVWFEGRLSPPRQHSAPLVSLPTDDMSEAPDAAGDAQQEHPVTVLLPSHSYSLTVTGLAVDATVGDLKRAIADQCPGRPAPSGQRIIVHGRVLNDNAKLVE